MYNFNTLTLLILGGSIGTIARYLLFLVSNRYLNHWIPWGTLIVNLLGSLLIGVFWSLMDKTNVTPSTRLFLFIGILGSFTTFSTFAFDNLSLFHSGAYRTMILNIVLNNVGGIGLCFAGYYLVKLFQYQ
ncbi:MAG: fluoride efflux transporter CrcB [Bacteroidales bacterium]|nr:fluoride efflux transporter CrcB [Bacteroidales bacterium]